MGPVRFTAHSSWSATSRNLVTASQSIHSLTHKHTHTSLRSTKPSGYPARSFHSFHPKQQGSQDSSLNFLLPALDPVTSLSPHVSLMSRCPFAFYVSLPPYRRKEVPLHPLHHSRTILQQLPLIMRAAVPFFILARQFNPDMHLFPRASNRLPGQPATGPPWHTCHDKRRHSGVPLFLLLLPFRTPFWPHLHKAPEESTSSPTSASYHDFTLRPLPLALLVVIYGSDVTHLFRYHLGSWWGGPVAALLHTLLRHTICAIYILASSQHHLRVDVLDTRATLMEDRQVHFSLTHLPHVPETPVILNSRYRQIHFL